MAKGGYIVTFGIKPTRPETGFGYIKVYREAVTHGQVFMSGQDFFNVERFTEKPDTETAQNYLKEGTYYWNAGIFAFQIGLILEEFARCAPAIAAAFDLTLDEFKAQFSGMPNISFDYAILEKTDKLITLPAKVYWNDIGSWDALFEISDKDGNGNVKTGDIISMDTRESMIIGEKRLITTIGLQDCLVVETGGRIINSKKGTNTESKGDCRQVTVGRAQRGLRT